ncbi:hypothetical protein ABZP36_007714 [Zizania latifolia]
MSEVMTGQFKILVSRFLAAEGLSLSDGGADKNWLDIVASLSWHAALLMKPDANVENAMNPGALSLFDSEVIKGLVFKKSAAHKQMSANIKHPKLLLVQDVLGHSENENLEKTLSDVIGKCQPDVILVEKAVSRNVFISYGKKLSGELLLSYGFVPKEGTNPNDSVKMLMPLNKKSSPRHVYVFQREFATVNPARVESCFLFKHFFWEMNVSAAVQVLEAFLVEGSELWMFNEVPEKERERKLIDGAMDIFGLTRITLVHKEDNAVIKWHLESLPFETLILFPNGQITYDLVFAIEFT